jgi:hypothetical protein
MQNVFLHHTGSAEEALKVQARQKTEMKRRRKDLAPHTLGSASLDVGTTKTNLEQTKKLRDPRLQTPAFA